ncbi:MAG: DUF5671 domain-containing protein [Acidobacteriota bacterium]
MSTIPENLSDFVKAALARGVPRTDIEAVLRQAGWTAAQIRSALAGFADADFPIPVPRPRPYLDAREAFLYLVVFSTLYLSVYHLGSLLFDIIDAAFPDAAAAASSQYARQSTRWSMASLIVAFPVFLSVSWLVGRDIAADPNKRQSKVRRWLTYLTLFLASATLIGDVISLIDSLLGGELTGRFVLKVLVIGLMAGTVLWYYLSDIRREE